jgi:hypothetical protein
MKTRLLPAYVVCATLLTGVVFAQSPPEPPVPTPAEQLADSLAKVKAGKFSGYNVEIIRRARATVAIPDLEKQFPLIKDIWDKAKIAQVLLSFGDRKDIYWNYLAELVKPALENDVPSPWVFDANGKSEEELRQHLLTWAKAHGKSADEAGQYIIYELPASVSFIGSTGDPRAIPILRRAFASPNSSIQGAAADGLAEMHDVASVPMMIERCKNGPPEVAHSIAESLVYFDDPEAQRMVDTYLPKDVAKELRQRRMSGQRP